MDKITVYKTVKSGDMYTCGDIGIPSEEWLGLLHKEKAEPYMDALLCFLREPEHKGVCKDLGLKYGRHHQYFNRKVSAFSEWVQKELGRFQVLGTGGKPAYWSIAMKAGWSAPPNFVWQLRDGLVDALRVYLMERLIGRLRQGDPFNGFDEEYKWELIDKAEGKNPVEIARLIIGNNIIDNARNDVVLKNLTSSKPSELSECLKRLFDESIPLDDRLEAFKKEMREICPDSWKNCANDERAASAFLTCKYPAAYTIYKDEIYQLLCQYFGYEPRKTGYKYSHFMQIINGFAATFGDEVQSVMSGKLERFRNKPLNLAVQTLFWCLKEYMKDQMRKEKRNYWLVGYTYGETDSQLDRFVTEGIWESIYEDDKDSDKSLLKLAMGIKAGDVMILKSTSTKGPDHNQPFLRVKCVGIVRDDVKAMKTDGCTRCKCGVKYISKDEKDFDGAKYGAFRKTVHLADNKVEAVIEYANELLENQESKQNTMYQQYIDLLKEARNLVLTGAPGTGKTHMAQAMAKEMGCGKEEMCLVQFHPSYDYTDFVEGLRPVERSDGQMGFERRDGVFKEFCRKAAKNLADSKKSVEELTQELSWEERLWQFVEDAMEKKTAFNLTNGNEFTIEEVRNRMIVVRNERNAKTTLVPVNADDIIELLTNDVPLDIVRDIRNYFERPFGTQPDSYAFILIKEIRKRKTKGLPKETAVEKVNRKDFVFIIDEINRGEASKIFGELFYAIDPGYRGKKDIRVRTQYQNLVPEGDLFAEGFYVPENVYILATMNDIDRSVESMDFAMRRRFTWHEVLPEDTESMLDGLDCAEEAKAAMKRLNEAIADTDGLGAAYAVGPSYFLKLGENGGDFARLWEKNIRPLLKEYLRGFRKADATLDKFQKAYFAKAETPVAAGSDELE